jgi:hypothetical protein
METIVIEILLLLATLFDYNVCNFGRELNKTIALMLNLLLPPTKVFPGKLNSVFFIAFYTFNLKPFVYC